MSRFGKMVIIIVVLIFTFGLLFVVSYFLKDALQGVELEEITLEEIDNLEIAQNANELIDSADIIVEGTYDGLNKTVNLYEGILPSPYESDEMYLLGRLFQFDIDEVLKGTVDTQTIDIVHIYSLPFKTEEVLGKIDTDAQEPDPTYISPSVEEKYIVFLKKTHKHDVYQRAMEPFLFEVNEENHQLQTKSKVLEKIDFDPGVLSKSLPDFKKTLEKEG